MTEHPRSTVFERTGSRPAVTFRAWRACGEAYPIDLGEPAILTDALNEALARGCLQHKDTLLICRDDIRTGRSELHAWTIKRKSQPRYVRGSDGTSKAVHDLYAAELFTCPVTGFYPIEPFDAFRDDPVGVDRTLVETNPLAGGE